MAKIRHHGERNDPRGADILAFLGTVGMILLPVTSRLSYQYAIQRLGDLTCLRTVVKHPAA